MRTASIHANGLVLFFSALFAATGCTPIMMSVVGMHAPKALDSAQVFHYAKKQRIPEQDIYLLDTSYKKIFTQVMDTATDIKRLQEQVKNHSQPLQALYYDQSGRLQSFHINCYAGGRLNLKWNRDGIMDVFPPRQQAPLDSLITLPQHLGFIKALQTPLPQPGAYDYVVVVHWNRFMGRQSKRLVRAIKKNAALAGDQKVKLLFVNTDNLYAGR